MGCAVSYRRDIERAVIGKLEPLLSTSGKYLRLVGHYNGELDSQKAGMDDIKRRLAGAQPAILVATSRAAYDVKGIGRERARVNLDLFLVIVSSHLNSHEARNLGDVLSEAGDPQADPGIFQIMEDAQQQLWNVDLGVVGAGRMWPIAETFIMQTPEFTVWRAHYALHHDALPAALPPRSYTSVEHRHNLTEDDAEPVNPVVVGEVPGAA